MKAFWGVGRNVGDRLTPIILRGLTKHEPLHVPDSTQGKLLMVGSLLDRAKANDTLLGVGSLDPEGRLTDPTIRVLALRGRLTAEQVTIKHKGVYGDPALLLPLIYKPSVKLKYKIGYIPHCDEKMLVDAMPETKLIDIEEDWQTVVRDILSCVLIISSSLHGIVLAEAYGIPAQWAVWSSRIAGGEFKYQDYFTGTDRKYQKPFTTLDTFNVKKVQDRLLKALGRL